MNCKLKIDVSYIWIICILFLLCNCSKNVIEEFPDIEPRPAVNSIINPQDNIKINVKKTTSSLNSPYYESIEHANVKIYENGVFVEDLFHLVDGNYYCTSLKPIAGNFYELKVEAPGFNTVLSADYMPQKIEWENIEIDSLNENGELSAINLKFSLDDPPEKNYYCMKYLQLFGGYFDTTNYIEIIRFYYWSYLSEYF